MVNKNRYANEILLIVGDEHRTGEEVYKELKKTYPYVGLGTVYRNLNLLVDNGSLMKTKGIGEYVLYEKKKKPHGHIMCKGSKKVFDISIDNLDIKQIDVPEQFEIHDIQILISGTMGGGDECIGTMKKDEKTKVS